MQTTTGNLLPMDRHFLSLNSSCLVPGG